MGETVSSISALGDNYIHVISYNGNAIAVDPGEARPLLRFLKDKNFNLVAILITHHHHDHVGGVEEIKKATRCKIIGPNDSRIPWLDQAASEGEDFSIGPVQFKVFDVPGHTKTHIAYYEPNHHWLFSGDSLFTGGCGRLFEGTPNEMLSSLNKLKGLPDETMVYCGHEYTLNNLKFAASIEPNNPSVKQRLEKVQQLRQRNTPTVPGSMLTEKATNPFLRSHSESLRRALNMEHASDLEVFTEVRSRKDRFRG